MQLCVGAMNYFVRATNDVEINFRVRNTANARARSFVSILFILHKAEECVVALALVSARALLSTEAESHGMCVFLHVRRTHMSCLVRAHVVVEISRTLFIFEKQRGACKKP